MSDPFTEAAWMLRKRGAIEFADAFDKGVTELCDAIERLMTEPVRQNMQAWRARAVTAEARVAELAKARETLLWLDHYEPELVASAESKFGFKLDSHRAALPATPEHKWMPIMDGTMLCQHCMAEYGSTSACPGPKSPDRLSELSALAAELAKAREALTKIANGRTEIFRYGTMSFNEAQSIARAALSATPEPGGRVQLTEDKTVTRFDDGSSVTAPVKSQPGQAATAAELGMTVEQMNRTHDLTHSLLAHWLGLPWSPTLHGVATHRYYPHHAAEEAAVLAIQRFARLAGVDLIELAKRAGICVID